MQTHELVGMAEAVSDVFIECWTKTKDFCAHWKELGVLLGRKISKLEEIEADNHHKSTNCLMKMLDTWLKDKPENSEEQLDNALRSLRKKHPNGEKCCVHMWLAARSKVSLSLCHMIVKITSYCLKISMR